MKRSSLALHLAFVSFIVVSIAALLTGIVAWQVMSHEVHRQASDEAKKQAELKIDQLTTIDQLTSEQVNTSMRTFQELSQLKGSATVKGTAEIAGKTVPDLHLGSESQVLNFAVVDHVKALAGGTATLFAWDGSNMIRVTTNVLKPDGSRAVGTALDAKGKAYAALSKGQPFHGVVDILGVPYTTSYIPIVDGSQHLAGAWYTGYRLDSFASLGRNIEGTEILEHGFVALCKPSGDAVFHGRQISTEALTALRKNPAGWVIREESYPAWGYTVLTAYPESDVTARLFKMFSKEMAGIILLVALVLTIQFVLLERLGLRPINELTAMLNNADLNTLLEAKRNDENT